MNISVVLLSLSSPDESSLVIQTGQTGTDGDRRGQTGTEGDRRGQTETDGVDEDRRRQTGQRGQTGQTGTDRDRRRQMETDGAKRGQTGDTYTLHRDRYRHRNKQIQDEGKKQNYPDLQKK